jgi:glycosyltransferase involved in cell wall biosynthesis
VNTLDTGKRYWTINGDFLHLRPTGIPRYAREVTLALDVLVAEGHALARGLNLRIVASRQGQEKLLLRAIELQIVPELFKPRIPQSWVQLQLPLQVRGGLVNLSNLGPVVMSKQITCIHDLHPLTMPESFGRVFRWTHRCLQPILGRRSSFVTTVSNYVGDQLVQFGVAPREKIVVTYPGHEHALKWRPENSKIAIGSRPFVLSLARDLKYKNTELIFRIARSLDGAGIDIYLAGEFDIATLESKYGPRTRNIRLFGRTSDDDFAKALDNALCFLFPSRTEGFGLPAVEAMSRGCPLIVASAGSLPEVCADAALYAGPDDDQGWLSAIQRIKNENGLRQLLIENGRERVQTFSWRKIAETYLSLMQMADEGRPWPR